MAMKADLHSMGGGEPGREELREWLRQWNVPAPPPQIEEDLREAFRRRRPKHGPAFWLILAAAAVLIAVWWIGSRGRAVVPVPAGTPVAEGSPPPPRVEGVRPPAPTTAPAALPTAASARPAPGRRRAVPRPPEVIVEPGQARLLADLGRRFGEVRSAVPGAAIPSAAEAWVAAPSTVPTMEATGVPAYQGEWETVAGDWPYVHVPRPGR
jgi:hypothetical protein